VHFSYGEHPPFQELQLSPLLAFAMLTEAHIAGIISSFIWITSFLQRAVPELLFGGRITKEQKTKFVFKETVERYKTSIKDVNRSLTLTIGLTVIALYAYFVLPAKGEVEIPLVAIKVSRQLWIRIVPAIAYGLQLFGFTALIWYMLLRLGLKMLLMEQTTIGDDYGDVTNVALDGILGHLWIILQIKRFYSSGWNYVWYVPALAVVGVVFFSPLALCLFFILRLFSSGRFDLVLGLVYSGLFFPYAAFFVLVVFTAAILGMGDVQMENQIAKGVELAKAVEPFISKLGKDKTVGDRKAGE
jgi:hypothetical protein